MRTELIVRFGYGSLVPWVTDPQGGAWRAVGGLGNLGPSAEGWQLQCALLDHLEDIWPQADHGIWEVRGDRAHFTNSKVMAWVAFDRAVKTVERFKMEGPVER